ncbi:MAG: hypothetical protein AAGJ37_17430, partial [Pseudomonadota bacterium]
QVKAGFEQKIVESFVNRLTTSKNTSVKKTAFKHEDKPIFASDACKEKAVVGLVTRLFAHVPITLKQQF